MQIVQGLFWIAVVIAYVYAVGWLFNSATPELVTIAGVIGAATIPLFYGKAVFDAFGRNQRRRLLKVPIVALLLLTFFDIAYLVLAIVSPLGAVVTVPIADVISPVVRWGTDLVGRELWRGVPQATGFVLEALSLSLVAKGVLLSFLLLLMRGLKNDVRDSKEPAFIQYFFAQAGRDLKKVVKDATTLTIGIFVLAGGWVWRASAGRKLIVLWPLTLTAYLAMLAPALVALLSLGVLLAVHLAGIGIVWAVAMYLALLVFALERAIIWARSGFAVCPHAACHGRVPNPVFFCAACGAEHKRLVPGRYGIFYRACQCERASLPTTFWLGKGKLRAVCTHCRGELNQRLFSGSVHVPIYGGPSAGKTTFMMSATWQMMEGRIPAISADFVNANDRTTYDHKWKPEFERGQVQGKTHQMLPSAFLVWLRRATGLPLSLYMYDPAGEAFAGTSEVEAHRFLEHTDGVALLIDPLSLESVARAYRDAGACLPSSASPLDALDLANRVVNALEIHLKVPARSQIPKPLAVVFTKSDVPLIKQTMGLGAPPAPVGGNWRRAGADRHATLESWVRTNEAALWQVFDTRFPSVRYFAVSALGHEPGAGGGFAPAGIEQPLCWLLSSQQAMARPRTARVVGRASELTAAFVVLAMFIAPLFAVTSYAMTVPLYRWRMTQAPPQVPVAEEPPVAPAPGAIAVGQGLRLAQVQQVLSSYYGNLGKSTFDAAGYFAPVIERYIQMRAATPVSINDYVRNDYPRQVRAGTSFRLAEGTLRAVADNVYLFDEASDYYDSSRNRQYSNIVHVCAEVNSDSKLVFFRQFTTRPLQDVQRCPRD